jgi:hypothetical protein
LIAGSPDQSLLLLLHKTTAWTPISTTAITHTTAFDTEALPHLATFHKLGNPLETKQTQSAPAKALIHGVMLEDLEQEVISIGLIDVHHH